MRLLFDQNLSPRLPARLADLWPDSDHVATLGLDRAQDAVVWQYALDHGYTIVSKDGDLSDMSLLRGSPPKVIWLQIGNCTTAQIESLLRGHREDIEAFGDDSETGILALS